MEKAKTVEVPERYRNAKRLLEEYKRLRAMLGKPIRTLDPEQIRMDLTGEQFRSLLEEIENVRDGRRKGKNSSESDSG